MLSHFSRVWLFANLWTVPARFLCLRDSPGKNTGVGCHAFLQGSSQLRDWTHISCFSALQVDSLPTEPPGKPIFNILRILNFLFKAKMPFCYTRHKPWFLWNAQSIPLGVPIVNIYIIMTIFLILWIKACTFCRCISSKNTSSEFLWGSLSMHY